ncbi:hypothetical protein GCM10020229_25940 [Kitasatospora albolonga]
MVIATVNPATGETLETFEPLGRDALELALGRAAEAAVLQRATGFEERSGLLRRAAELLDAERDRIAVTVTTEMGKPLAQARAEAAKCAKALRWYADHGAALIADERPADEDVADSGGRLRVRPLPPVRGGARGDAVELPALAGGPLPGPGSDGRERRTAQARLQRAAHRPHPGPTCSAGPARRPGSSRPC